MINLLPLPEKRILQGEERWRLILTLGILILIFFLCFSLLLFSIKTYILGQVESQRTLVNIEEKQFKTAEIKALQEEITTANQNLTKLNSFYQDYIYLTEILEQISEILPVGVYLTVFSYQKETSQVSLSGFAPLRETLFEFKQNLEKQEDFTEIQFPPSNWVQAEAIDFFTTFKILQ